MATIPVKETTVPQVICEMAYSAAANLREELQYVVSDAIHRNTDEYTTEQEALELLDRLEVMINLEISRLKGDIRHAKKIANRK